MPRPTHSTLWTLGRFLVTLAVLDVIFTSIGILYFSGAEGNPLIVYLADALPRGTITQRVILTVWLSKISIIAVVLLAIHQVVKSNPARDDWAMFYGLLFSLLVYVGVVGSWLAYFILVWSA